MERPLRIGVNALYLIPGGVGGTEIYLRGLLAGLARLDRVNRYFLFTNRETGPDLTPKLKNFTEVPQPVRGTIRPARILWEQTVLPVEAARLRLDVMLNPGFTAPLLCGCPQVTVFHDLQHKRHPEYFRWFDLPFWRFFLYWSARVSRLLIAISESTAKDLERFYRTDAKRVRVVPLGVDAEFFAIGEVREPEPLILAVSTLHPHKNLDGLMEAFAEFRRERPEFRLVVCGLHGFATETLRDTQRRLGLETAVEFPGWIPRHELHDLYRRAWAFVYPTLFEGFGLPVVEAMAAAIPTICSNIEPVGSIVGRGALQFDPRSRSAMVEALRRVTGEEELRRRLAWEGPRRAGQFSWDAMAEAILGALRSAAR